MRNILIATFALISSQCAYAAEPWQISAENVEEIFWHNAVDTCDLKQLATTLGDHFQYVHDEIGVTYGKAEMIDLMQHGVCAGPKMRREVIPGSVRYFPLRDIRSKSGETYGAIVTGEHLFFEHVNGGPEATISWGRFTHILAIENGKWVFSEVVDYANKEF